MSDNSGQIRALHDEGAAMFTLDGRDRARTHDVMATLWSRAITAGVEPVRWEIGFFNMRDLEEARDSDAPDRRVFRTMELAWGCSVDVVAFYDTVALIVHDPAADDDRRRFQRLILEDYR